MDPEVEAVVKRFVENYYCRAFDANQADLANLYREESVLTFDGQEIKGKEAILAKLTSLPFRQCQHHIGTIDCLPFGRAVFVLVTGNIRLDGKQDTLDFSQVLRAHYHRSFKTCHEIVIWYASQFHVWVSSVELPA